MRFVRAGMAVALGVVLAAQPTVAGAERLRQRDAVGDVARSLIDANLYTPVPAHVQGDIVATRIIHAPRVVWIRVRMRDLTMDTNGNFHRIEIISDRRSRSIEIDAFPGHWEGQVTTTNPLGAVVLCGVRARIDYDRNLLMVRVPRRCLGKPQWVRVGIRTTVAGTRYSYADDARATGLGPALSYSKRVRH